MNLPINTQYHRVNVADKAIINGKSDVNQLVPFKYKWAWDKYLATCANHWMPQEVSMSRDIELWKSPNGLTEDERRIIKRNLGFFTTADSLAANNIVLGTYRHITAPECRQFLLRQAFEEAIHCYIDGTEILTEDGFVDFRNLDPKKKVAQYHKSGSISFVYPDEVLHDDYEGDVVELKSQDGSYQSIVTPNHRCVVVDPTTNITSIVLAKDLEPKNYNFPTTGFGTGKTKLDVFSDIDYLLMTYTFHGIPASNQIHWLGTNLLCFVFDDSTHLYGFIKRASAIINGCSVYAHDNGSFELTISVSEELTKLVSRDFSWIELTDVSHVWISLLFGELNFLTSRNKLNAISGEYIYTIPTSLEHSKSIIEKLHALTSIGGISTKIITSDDYYTLVYSNDGATDGRAIVKTTISNYSGEVHCVGVPTGMIITRYNGSIVVSGNTHAYQYIVESLGMDESEIFNAYNEIPSIRNKDEFLIPYIEAIMDPMFKTGTMENDQVLLKSLIAFACLMEGLFFYVGFTQILAMGRQNKMVGAAEQYQYILRDESMHCNFGIDLINQLKLENPNLWTDEFQKEIIGMFHKAVELEYAYAEDTMPRGVLGLNASMFKGYLRYIANRRATQIGLPELFPNEENPFPWMSEMLDLKKERNFFETRVIDYQTGGSLNWD